MFNNSFSFSNDQTQKYKPLSDKDKGEEGKEETKDKPKGREKDPTEKCHLMSKEKSINIIPFFIQHKHKHK